MKVDKKDMLLYLVTDRTWLKDQTLPEVVESVIKNNVTFVQLREKKLDYISFRKLAIEIKEITDKYEVPFVISEIFIIICMRLERKIKRYDTEQVKS